VIKFLSGIQEDKTREIMENLISYGKALMSFMVTEVTILFFERDRWIRSTRRTYQWQNVEALFFHRLRIVHFTLLIVYNIVEFRLEWMVIF